MTLLTILKLFTWADVKNSTKMFYSKAKVMFTGSSEHLNLRILAHEGYEVTDGVANIYGCLVFWQTMDLADERLVVNL
ncbi:hypothetical protein AB669_20960 [Pedobacter sp. BMA]|nr:hypothetical protein AB669_20960 [Pedobacter sp. BMA]